VVLQQCRRDSEDRWKRMSRQVVDFLLPLLQQQQVTVTCQTIVVILSACDYQSRMICKFVGVCILLALTAF